MSGKLPACPRAVLIDWDNTLVDTWPVIHDAMNTTLKAMGEAEWQYSETKRRVRRALRDRYRVATTVGYGPRFLHSTGQLHKGGPNTGVFIQVLDDEAADLSIPDKPFTFGTLKRAQALGDLQALLARDRRVTRVTMRELLEVQG